MRGCIFVIHFSFISVNQSCELSIVIPGGIRYTKDSKAAVERGEGMSRTVSIGCQDFETIRREGYFYIDKTCFIREWWERGDSVTLITRPRRFGKTLTMSMLEKFFSVEYAGRTDLFSGLKIWEEAKYQQLQGTYPVIFISFASVKEDTFLAAQKKIFFLIAELYNRFDFLLDSGILKEAEKEYYHKVSFDMEAYIATDALKALSGFLARYYGKKVIILLDEYDTPMQEAYFYGYWEELAAFTRSLFNAAFKTNPYLERAVMTGITRVSRESMFSDLNNLKVVTVTSEEYGTSFGFTEEEVFAALDEFSLSDRKEDVIKWYDGFTFGSCKDIYNPWSIVNFLDTGKIRGYWINTSSNSLAGKLLQEGSQEMKIILEDLLGGGTFHAVLDEQIVFSRLGLEDASVWNLLLAGGYLTATHAEPDPDSLEMKYELKLTNREVRAMFLQLIKGWFGPCQGVRNIFLRAMLSDDLETMNESLNEISGELFSSFDTGRKPSEKAQPERFYHGFVLGLIAELQGRYAISSNRESGLGRYDIMLEPKKAEDPAFIIEFKVVRGKRESLEDCVRSALQQIEERRYETILLSKGIAQKQIQKYGFAFDGSRVLIGKL